MAFENVLPANADTLLTISGFGDLLYQARGLTQTLSIIKEANQQEYSVNATLVDLSNPIFRKFASKIQCTDINAPPLDGLWPGMTVEVGCAVTLCYLTGNLGSPSRPQVSGSSYEQGSYTFYRPVLTMVVGDLSQHFEEWKADILWELNLREK